jgi:hypothetical protein
VIEMSSRLLTRVPSCHHAMSAELVVVRAAVHGVLDVDSNANPACERERDAHAPLPDWLLGL